MTERRFTDKFELDPASVYGLRPDHPAMLKNRTLFPTTVVDIDEDFKERLLVSGRNNRKLGETIAKGKFVGYQLYGLSLEERATCPAECEARSYCYGNGMQMARRHRIADMDAFCRCLEDEVATILIDPVPGLMIRLHVLGDFPSVEYVALWADLLAEHDRLACYGYTHRKTKNWGGDEIGDAIQSVKDSYPDRFRIRWSGRVLRPDSAIIIDYVPKQPRIEEGIICPAQTDATGCCSSCALCWDAKFENIVFIKHGPKSDAASAEVAMRDAATPIVTKPKQPDAAQQPRNPAPEDARPIKAIQLPPSVKPKPITTEPPEVREADPRTLQVEAKYQRDLSGRSLKLIKKIIAGWDWAKFKPPVCAETEHGLFVIDGQHTAIAAASHPEIETIPVMVVSAEAIERRAEAFVSHNRDRLAMTPAQVFYGEVASGNEAAKEILAAVLRASGSIPRLPVLRSYAKPGQITAIGELRQIHSASGATMLERIVRIAALSRAAPISLVIARALRIILTEERFEEIAALPDPKIAAALGSLKNIEAASQHYAAETGQSRFRACAGLIAAAAQPASMKEAAE